MEAGETEGERTREPPLDYSCDMVTCPIEQPFRRALASLAGLLEHN